MRPLSTIRRAIVFATICFMPTLATADTAPFQDRLIGDLGLGAFATQSVVRGGSDSLTVLPYAIATYGRYFARLDTLGAKTLPVGFGHIELIARINFDGFTSDTPELQGLNRRKHSVPLGIGTLQKTPVGAFFLNAFHDVNASSGNLIEVIYGAKFTLGPVTAYPLFGAEYRDMTYVSYYYGVSPSESVASGKSEYRPAGALNPIAAIHADIPIMKTVKLSLYWRRLWLDSAIANSPIVANSTKDNAFVAISYRFD